VRQHHGLGADRIAQGLLGAALVVRDEERFLPGCLESIAPIVDEIVVVDTGSKDGTPTIARSHGARVLEFPWTGDFAAARNVALGNATCRWTLYIDADERIRPCPPGFTENLADRDGYCCLTVRFHPRVGSTPYREYRILRNDPRIRFEGVIHETMLPSLRSLEREGLQIGKSDLTIDHLGYEGDQHHKHERNLPLLEEGVRRDPLRMYNWWHLGSVYREMGRIDDAIEAWQHAIELARGNKRPGAVDSLPFMEVLNLKAKLGQDVEPLLSEARHRFPWNWALVWIEATKHVRDENYEKASELYRSLANVDIETIVDDGMAYEEQIFGRFASEGLATALFRLGRYGESADSFEQALRHDPANVEYRAKGALARARATQQDGSLEA
jgi:glycosyltransferase involved in cell wall biosynthesis